jgi:hypothetical protein
VRRARRAAWCIAVAKLLPATKSRSCETLEYPAASSSASTQAAQGRSAPVKLTKKSRSTLPARWSVVPMLTGLSYHDAIATASSSRPAASSTACGGVSGSASRT